MFDNQNTAQNIFLGSNNQSFTGLVSNNDPADYYNLHITSRSNVNVGLSGLTSDANLYLFDNNSKLLASSTNIGNASESIKTVMDIGNYFVKVDRSILNNNSVFTSSPYQLSFSNDPLFNNTAVIPVKHNDPLLQPIAITPTYTIGSDGTNNLNTAFINTYNQISGSRVLGKAIDNVHSIAGGTVQDFESGHIFQSSAGTFAVQGTLNTFYNNLSVGDKLKLGLPTTNETSVGGYWHQAFQNGDLQLVQGAPVKWSNQTLINDRFNLLGGTNALGQSIGSIHNVNGVPVQDYAKGSIFVFGNKTVAVTSAIATYYRANMTTLGLPTSEESTASYGKSQTFQGALVTSSTQFGVHTLHGSVVGYYTGLTAAQKDQLGAATTEEAVGGDGNWQQFFKGGSVLWKSNGTGELKLTPYTIGFDGNSVNSAFTTKFNQVVGWTALGQPIGNVVSFNGGKLQDFAQGTICQVGNNVFTLQGQIGNYVRDNIGTFGLPTSEQVTTSYGKKQEFQNGLVMQAGAAIRTVQGNIWNYYRGLSATQQEQLGVAAVGAAAINSDGNLQQSFTGGTVIWKKNGTGEVKFGSPNIAPQAPVINGIKSSYDADQTLSIDSGYAYDANGWQDVSKVDFWLTNSQNQRIELTDVNSFFYNSQNWAQFVYSTSLTGLAAGDYKLNEVAYDKTGAASNQSSQSFTIKAKNIAPQAPLVYGVKSSYDANSTLTIDSGYAYDANGWQDVSKVDFWLTNSQNQRIELTDANSFITYSQNYAQFQYSTNLNGIVAGDYKLNAVAYDKAGAASNQFSQALTIKALNIAPQAPVITGIKSSYDANSTLTIDDGYVADTNGWQDVSKVDFWLTNAQGVRVELSDVSDFAVKDANSARFSYTTTLSGIAAGSYQLNAVAYDKAGIASDRFSQALTIKAANIAPTTPVILGIQSSYDANSTLKIDPSSYVSDSNGWQDVSKVDFWLTNAQNQRIELTDATSFTPNAYGLAKFDYSASLAGLAAGEYKLNAIAFDKANAASNQFSQSFTIKAANVAPQAPVITGIKASYDANSLLTIDSGLITDTNGWQDITKVQFWLTDTQGNKIGGSDVTSFSANSANTAQFNYSTSLNGISVGTYKLNAVAYDKAGAASNQFSQSFAIKAADRDWFSLNLKDASTIALARTEAADGKLDRNDMIAIMRDMEDGSVVDTSEISDLKSLLATTTPFSISEPVRYLANKVATEYSTNMSSTAFETNDLGKWFLGTIAPIAQFKGQTIEYEKVTGRLFGTSNQARIGDIDQGQIGDCVLLASLGATFAPQFSDLGNSNSKTINDMLIDNGDNTYTVRFFTQDQKAEWVTVDNRLAKTQADWNLFRANSNDNIMWAPIIEKACAQWREFNEKDSAESISNGWKSGWDIIGKNGDRISKGLQRITGRVATCYTTTDTTYDFDFSLIQQSFVNGKAIIAGSAQTNNVNLIGSHAYSVTNAYVNSNGEQRVVVRNPWGVDYSSYTFSDSANDGFLDLSYSQFRNLSWIAIS